jgi:hypothetical protein
MLGLRTRLYQEINEKNLTISLVEGFGYNFSAVGAYAHSVCDICLCLSLSPCFCLSSRKKEKNRDVKVIVCGIRLYPHTYAFEKQDVIDMDVFTLHRLLYWMGMQSNSFEVKKFVAEYFLLKCPDDSFWIPILKRRDLL